LTFRRSTNSVSGSFLEEIFENGRRYAHESYYLPNDEPEEIRASITHQTYFAALSNNLTFHRLRPQRYRILDVGAGPGDWAIAMAEQMPESQIVASDIWPFEPHDIPQNLYYRIEDARQEWTYSEPFDYIFMRGLVGAFSDWKFIYEQAYKHGTDGAVLEISDWSLVKHNTDVSDSYLDIFNAACQSAAENAGISLGLEHMQKQILEETGFRVFRSASIDIPVGQWHQNPRMKLLGKLAFVSVLEGLESQSLRLLTKYLDWPVEEVQDLCQKVQEELAQPDVRPSLTCQVVVARKLLAFDA
jgi:SAM-dependent methyltransferase